jgi:hypothetical protein
MGHTSLTHNEITLLASMLTVLPAVFVRAVVAFVVLALPFGAGAQAHIDARELLVRVKRLVDDAALFDEQAVKEAFPMGAAEPSSWSFQKEGCQPGSIHHVTGTRWKLGEWFTNTAAGITHLSFEGAMAPPDGRLHKFTFGDPEGSFAVHETVYCSDLFEPLTLHSARLQLSNLPGFACLKLHEVDAIVPLKDNLATDGAGIYSYTPPALPRAGALITVSIGGGPCVSELTVDQEEAWGKQYLRAKRSFQECTRREAQKFSKADASHDLKDRDEMERSSAKACGGFGLFYLKARSQPN